MINTQRQKSPNRSTDGFIRSVRRTKCPTLVSVVPPITTRIPPVTPIKPISPKRNWKKRLKRTSLVLLAIFLIGGGWVGSKIIGNVNKVFHGSVFSDVHALVSNATLKGEAQGRVNILLAGDSADDPNHGGAELTDSIMLVSIDTIHHNGFMLSIPRDTWVSIPGMGHQKINAANEVTKFSQVGYPNGGMGQLEQIITAGFGIPVNYYALINYTAFRDAVNAVGGVSITIDSPDPRGLFDPNIAKADGGPLKLPNGSVTLNGQTALELARARGDPCGCRQVEYGFPQSDFNRTQHQRQLLTALEQKASSAGVLSNPIKVGQLFNALGSNVSTDLSLTEAIRTAQLTKSMNLQNLQSLTLSSSGEKPLLKDYIAYDGEEALIPNAGIDNFSQIRAYYQLLTGGGNTVATVAQEAPSVVVLNGSNVTGLARKEQAALQQKGFNVVGVADTNSQYLSSLIIDNTKNKKTISMTALQQSLGPNTTITSNPTSSAEANESKGYNADFVVVLGKKN